MPDELSPPRIVCAAIRLHGYHVLGVRHFDTHMRNILHDAPFGYEFSHWLEAEQGFVDQHGKFLNRSEAWEVALKAGQVIRRCGPEGGTELYSEHLY